MIKLKKSWIFFCIFILCLTGCAAESGTDGHKTADIHKNYEFIFVCPIMENEYWEACMDGIRKADEKLGTHTSVIGPQTADNFAEEIVGYMEEAIEANPDGIMVYSGIEELFPLINRARGQGIPVISIDSDAPSTSRVAYIGTDLYNLGYKSGETLVDLADGDIKIGYVCSTYSATNEETVFSAFQDAINDYGMEVVAKTEGHADPEYAAKATQKMLEEHPEITAIYCTGGYNATGAAMAKEALKRDDLVLVGLDDVEENLNYVRLGVIDALLVQSPRVMGYQGVSLMKEYLDKNDLLQTSYDTGSILVTKSNVDSYASDTLNYIMEGKTVRVGYYGGSENFQSGTNDEERKSGYAYEYYQEISSLTGWNYEYIYGTRDEIIHMLLKGEVDIAAGIYKTDLLEHQVLFPLRDMGLDGKARYFAVNKNREDLLEELNYALDQIAQYSPELIFSLRQKYYGQITRQQVLSDRERQWLENLGTMRIGYVRHNMPFSEQASDGTPTGLIKDLIETFSFYLQMDIDAVCYENIEDMEKGLSQGEIDAAFPIYLDLWLSESKGFRQTDAFLSDRVMVIYQGTYSDDIINQVALSETGIGQRYYMDAHYPEAEIHFYASRKETFDAIKSGEEKCIIGCSSILQRYMMEHPEFDEFNIAYLDTTEDFGIAVRQDSSILTGILNKAIGYMGDTAITSALMQYSSIEAEYSFSKIIRRYSVPVIGFLAVFIAILIYVFVLYRHKTALFNREQAKTQAALEEALKASNVASEAKTNFLSSMSHDIRTPMNAIIGMTSIATHYLDDKVRLADCLEKISVSSQHLLTLINNVLDISKIESGKLVLNPVNFSLKDTVTAIVDIIRPQLQSKELEFDIHVSGVEHEIIYADEVRINQIFINILSNAVKYTPEGGTVTVNLTQETLPDDNHVKLVYSVKDTGIGMSKEYMKDMYENFSRAKDSRTDKIQGTGLGLSIVKQIVDIMGGTIDCQSEENKGTQFEITLTVPIGEDFEKELSLPPVRVLLADDDDLFLESTGESLRELGLIVDTVHDGESALDMASMVHDTDDAYKIYIVDIKMPEMNGVQTIRAIRDIVGPEPLFFLTSAYEWDEIEENAKECGITGFINKPVFRSGIYEKLRNALGIEHKSEDEKAVENDILEGINILIAEDNDLNWEIIEELLNMYGITSERAENGQICVDKLAEATPQTYDMILMDIQMPVMNGREAARAIRAHAEGYVNSIPIIAMTADAFAEDIAASFEAGMDGHVSKPVDMNDLFQEMRRVLEKRKK